MAERSRRHQEYLELHRTLSVRYDQALYARSEAVNVALLRSVEDAPDESAFKLSVWNSPLVIDDAKSLLRDVAEAEAALWDELGDPVQASGARSLVSRLDAIVNMMTLAEVEAETEIRRDLELQLDELVGEFGADFAALEDIDMWETADVPERWREELDDRAATARVDGARRWAELTDRAREIDPSWVFDEAAVWEPRHRRRIPFPDHVVSERLSQHRRYRGA